MYSSKSYQEKVKQKIDLDNTLHKNLDKFIQSCLSKYKIIEPQKELYDKCGSDKNLIISHKSTIPDLVIWNKTFNKNECFNNCDTSKINPFPRYKFFLRLNHSKDKKKKNKKNKNKKNKNLSGQCNLKSLPVNNEQKILNNEKEKNNLEKISNLIEKIDLKDSKKDEPQEYDKVDTKEKTDKKENILSSLSPQEEKEKIIENSLSNEDNSNFIRFINSHHQTQVKNAGKNLTFNTEKNNTNKSIISPSSFQNNNNKYETPNSYNNNNLNSLNQNTSFRNNSSINYGTNYLNIQSYNNNRISLFSNNKTNNYSVFSPATNKNKSKKTMNDYYPNQFKQNELLMNFVYSYLETRGWIVFENNGNYISNYSSFELFAFLTNILKNNNDLKSYIVGMPNNSTMFNGEQIYIILSQTLPIILQKKQYELIQHEKEVEKKNKNIENENIKNTSKKENDESNYNNLNCYRRNISNYNKNEKEDNKDVCEENEDDEDNYYDFNLNNNNFFLNQQQELKCDNFDSSIFGQGNN